METRQWKLRVIDHINLLCRDGKITDHFARELIEDSAWWEKHPTAGAVRAPGHANNIGGRNGSYFLTFGSNTFLITIAVCRCCSHIKQWLNVRDTLPGSLAVLYAELTDVLRGSVSNHEDEEYDYYYGGTGERIVFGVQAISANGFIRCLLAKIKLHDLYSYVPPYNYKNASHSEPTKYIAEQKLSICPWCQAKVSPGNLPKHMSYRCPKRPQK